MIKKARLQLTLWYMVITMLLIILCSYVIYIHSGNTIQNILQEKLRSSQQVDSLQRFKNVSKPITTSEIDAALQHLRFLIISFDLTVLILVGVSGYFLAGRTLKPVEKNMEEQKRFVTDASHEFRTPLTALKTSIEVNLPDKDFQSKAVQDLLQRNLYQIDKLQNLADNLLHLAQYQNKSKIQLTPLSVESIITLAIEKVQSLAEAKHITISQNITDATVKGEKESLIELFTILLDNAIKYSHEKTHITIKGFIDAKSYNIAIQDEGIGIAKKDIKHIFDRFYRSDTSRSKSGFGLGLSIAKRIVTVHKGKIFVASVEGKGATLTVQFPLNA